MGHAIIFVQKLAPKVRPREAYHIPPSLDTSSRKPDLQNPGGKPELVPGWYRQWRFIDEHLGRRGPENHLARERGD